MAMTEREDQELEELFAEARALGPVPSEDLFRRILAEADAVAAERRRPAAAPARARAGWREWLRALGGWPVVGGLAASAVAGLWIGASAPAVLSDLLPSAWGEQVSVSFGVDEDPLSLLEG